MEAYRSKHQLVLETFHLWAEEYSEYPYLNFFQLSKLYHSTSHTSFLSLSLFFLFFFLFLTVRV